MDKGGEAIKDKIAIEDKFLAGRTTVAATSVVATSIGQSSAAARWRTDS